MRLIEIKKADLVIFVGDTHGDLEVSQKVVGNYLNTDNKIVFLGDYVDRGPFSKANLDFLLETKRKNPEKIYLLQGNHEGYPIIKFFPADFWESLDERDYKKYSAIVIEFPLALIVKNILALHAVPPDLKTMKTNHIPSKEINKIKLGSKEWQQITWGDFYEEKGDYLGQDLFSGRSRFGKDYFLKIMKRFDKNILIRSHQPDAPQFMFDDRCLTIFSSSIYARERTIAILDFKKEIKSAKDLEIKKI